MHTSISHARTTTPRKSRTVSGRRRAPSTSRDKEPRPRQRTPTGSHEELARGARHLEPDWRRPGRPPGRQLFATPHRARPATPAPPPLPTAPAAVQVATPFRSCLKSGGRMPGGRSHYLGRGPRNPTGSLAQPATAHGRCQPKADDQPSPRPAGPPRTTGQNARTHASGIANPHTESTSGQECRPFKLPHEANLEIPPPRKRRPRPWPKYITTHT